VGNTGIAAALAVAAALMVGIGDVVQQRSAQQVTDQPVGTVALFRRLLRDRRWWAGSLVAVAGFGFQAAALGVGSVVLVQALLVTSLLFALVISARANHRRVTRRQGIWAALLVAAVAVIVTVGDPQAGAPRGSVRPATNTAPKTSSRPEPAPAHGCCRMLRQNGLEESTETGRPQHASANSHRCHRGRRHSGRRVR
jgi:drug/metabolite transporter (DMT)-like permease